MKYSPRDVVALRLVVLWTGLKLLAQCDGAFRICVKGHSHPERTRRMSGESKDKLKLGTLAQNQSSLYYSG